MEERNDKPSDQASLPFVEWLKKKESQSQAEILHFLQANKDRLEKTLAAMDKRSFLYRLMMYVFSWFAVIASGIDRVKNFIVDLILKIPAPAGLKQGIRAFVDEFSFKGVVEFVRAKMYSLKKAPLNARVVQLMDEVISHATKQGLDVKQHFPEIIEKFVARKNQLLQHSFFKEFSKSFLERLLAIPFSFNRSISPVLADSALWHKLFVFLERRNIKDIILVDKKKRRVSINQDSKHAAESSQVVRTLYEASVLKAKGHRIFIIGHHEGYLGPYFVRSVFRKLGFDNLTGNCNTVVGPRMFSNLVLKSGASNVGNLFLTLPSQKTTQVKEAGLAEALQKNARRTQFLIKMPNAGLKLIEAMSFEDFVSSVINYKTNSALHASDLLTQDEKDELITYLDNIHEFETLNGLDQEDYELFKSVMYEPFLLFPEGSRSYTDEKGDVTMKYVNPRYMEAYLRPGDVILPVNLVGGSDITNGWRLSPAELGLSVASPYEVNAEMISNFETEGLNVMRKIADLENIKRVTFDESIQSRKTLVSDAA